MAVQDKLRMIGYSYSKRTASLLTRSRTEVLKATHVITMEFNIFNKGI